MANIEEKFKAIYENVPLVYESGYQKGLKEGNNAWDFIQNKGNRVKYTNAFYDIDVTDFYPKYNMKPTVAVEMFRDTANHTPEKYSLVERLRECGVVLDFSECKQVTYCFYQSAFTELPELNFSNAGTSTQYLGCGSATVTIQKLILNNNGQPLKDFFGYAYSLKNIIIEGKIAYTDLNLKNCKKLTIESLRSILSALIWNADGPNAYGCTISLPEECWELLDADTENSYNGMGWKSYLYYIGWNRA